jgi:hypothetical protein
LTARFLATAENGIAQVVSSHERPTARGGPWWTTTFSVALPDGTRLTASWTGARRFARGEAVRVIHRRTPPVRVQPDDQRPAWRWAWVLAGVGGAHLLAGGSLLLIGALLRRGTARPCGARRADTQ